MIYTAVSETKIWKKRAYTHIIHYTSGARWGKGFLPGVWYSRKLR
jgi:hypothetical protein